MSLKISATSASLISSGKVKEDPKKINMEDGKMFPYFFYVALKVFNLNVIVSRYR